MLGIGKLEERPGELVLTAVSQDPYSYTYASAELKADHEIALVAMKEGF